MRKELESQEMGAPRRRRLNAHGTTLRRRRIFARLREGLGYEEIAAAEGVTAERIRQIVSAVLEKRTVDSGADHAKLQLDRLAPALQVAAEAIAAGDVSAIPSYLKVLDRLDRYQTVACANQVYDDEARRKLMARVNRIAENLGIDADFEAAVRERLREQGIVGDEGESHESRTQEGGIASPDAPAGEDAWGFSRHD